jgi:hypothetical protein
MLTANLKFRAKKKRMRNREKDIFMNLKLVLYCEDVKNEGNIRDGAKTTTYLIFFSLFILILHQKYYFIIFFIYCCKYSLFFLN